MFVTIYTDGSARGNPDGPGGYGAVIEYIDSKGHLHEKILSAGYDKTTNNRMELMGAIAAFEALNKPCDVTFYSDSKYVIDAFLQDWTSAWIQNGWKTAAKKPVKNKELWERLLAAVKHHSVKWNWVKGHAGHAQNERCDELATKAADADCDTLLHDDGGDLRVGI